MSKFLITIGLPLVIASQSIFAHDTEEAKTTPSSTGTIQQEFEEVAKQPGSVIFTPPNGWKVAEKEKLPQSIKAMVVGVGSHEYPPSINLGVEPFEGTLRDYVKTVKAINEAQKSDWKDLGMIHTQAGNADLSQVDISTEWGTVRLMHAIIVKSGTAYILTAAALKEEFPKFYKEFFASMRSLRFNEPAKEKSKT